MAIIVLDAGHGGTRSLECSSWNNSRGPDLGTLEKDLTLDVGLRAREELERRGGHRIVTTRDTDTNLSGVERGKVARQYGADVLVSIHFNGSDRHNAQGTETFVHTRHSNNGDSAELCRAVQAAVVRATGLRDRNRLHPPHFIKKASWCVINPGYHAAGTAAVLTEVSFLDRADEERRLQRDSYKQEIAIAIADGIENYLGLNIDHNLIEPEMEDRFEDAVSTAAAEAGVDVEAMMRFDQLEASHADRERRAADDSSAGTGATERVLDPDLFLDMAMSLAGRPERSSGSDSDINDHREFTGINAACGVDLSTFGLDQRADAEMLAALFEGNEAEAAGFDHQAFADFIEDLDLRYFRPVEFLYLGASNAPLRRCAGRNRLPGADLWPNIANTAKMLDEIRHRLGAPIRILSGYRSESYNRCVGGASRSPHKAFNALDWTCSSGSVSSWRDVAETVRAGKPEYAGGIGYYPDSRFIHVDTRGSNANW